MTAWCEMRMASVDLETTSADPLEARMVSAAVAFVGGGEETDSFTVLADPGVEIPAEATRIHKITTEQARAEGIPAAAAVSMVLEAIDRRKTGAAVIACNARFDLTVMHHEAIRHGLEPLTERGDLYVVDPLVVDRHLDRYRPGGRKLIDLCGHYGARHDGAHDAAADAIAAARVAWKLGNHADVVRRAHGPVETRELRELCREWDLIRHDLPALHAAQCRWAAFQAEGLEQHFKRNGKTGQFDREWPVITGRLI